MEIEKKIENMRSILNEGYRKGISPEEMLALSQKLDSYIAEYYYQKEYGNKNLHPAPYEKQDANCSHYVNYRSCRQGS